MNVKIYDDHETILQPGKVPNCIYFIDKAEVNVVDPTGLFNLVALRKGSYFGEYPVLHQMGTNFTFVTGKSNDLKDKSGM